MANMYYEEHPDVAHDIHEITVELLGQTLRLLTDSGVFSKKMVDYGSQVLLNTLDFQQGERLLDVGCGYGPLGIALAKAQGLDVTMIDINQRAVALAQKNAEKNGAGSGSSSARKGRYSIGKGTGGQLSVSVFRRHETAGDHRFFSDVQT